MTAERARINSVAMTSRPDGIRKGFVRPNVRLFEFQPELELGLGAEKES